MCACSSSSSSSQDPRHLALSRHSTFPHSTFPHYYHHAFHNLLLRSNRTTIAISYRQYLCSTLLHVTWPLPSQDSMYPKKGTKKKRKKSRYHCTNQFYLVHSLTSNFLFLSSVFAQYGNTKCDSWQAGLTQRACQHSPVCISFLPRYLSSSSS